MDAARFDQAALASQVERYGKLPLWFETNQGQTDSQVKFVSRGIGYSLFLTAGGLSLKLGQRPRDSNSAARGAGDQEGHRPAPDGAVVTALRLKLLGANLAAPVAGLDPQPGRVNYFLGSDPTGWRAGISAYARVKYEEVYPGIDWVVYGNQQQLEYDFIVRPGADPGRIRLTFEGAEGVALEEGGALVLRTAGGEVRQHRPLVYQEVGGVRREINSRLVFKETHEIGFEVAAYDPGKPLVIDPVLSYSTLLGGSFHDFGNSIAVDPAGHAYVAGYAGSTDFPATAGAYQTTKADGADAFVAKLNAGGTGLIYSTYLGGRQALDVAADIAVDEAGNAYITGDTVAADFPTTPGAFQRSYRGSSDNFVAKLSPDGGALIYSTYLGGSNLDYPGLIAVDAGGNAYVTGATISTDYPTTAGVVQPALAGGFFRDGVVTKLNAAGTGLVYSTYLGGAGNDSATGIAVDGAGNAYVTGESFPNVYVAKLTANAGALLYVTRFGGGDFPNRSYDLALDKAGNAYVTGGISAVNFPVTTGAAQPVFGGGFTDAFIVKVNQNGVVTYATFLGGRDQDSGYSLAVDEAGNIYVTGRTISHDFPIVPGALQLAYAGAPVPGGGDAFVAKLNAAGSSLVYSTFLGGSEADEGRGLAVDQSGAVYVTGQTQRPASGTALLFPTTPGAFQPVAPRPTSGSSFSIGFVAKIDGAVFSAADLALSITHAGDFVVATSGVYRLTVTNVGATVSAGTITVADALPPGLTFSSFTGAGWTCRAAAAEVVCATPRSLAPGESTTVTLEVDVRNGAYPGVTNVASLSNLSDINPANNSAADSTSVLAEGVNPVPFITSLSPATARVGTRRLNLAVSGLNFVAGSVLRWEGKDYPVRFVSSKKLTVEVAPENLRRAGTARLVIFNPGPGGGVSNQATLRITRR